MDEGGWCSATEMFGRSEKMEEEVPQGVNARERSRKKLRRG